MSVNNINLDNIKKFKESVKKNPSEAEKSKKVIGEWRFEEGNPQFSSVLEYKNGTQQIYADAPLFSGGNGLAPDPLQYCLFGLCACFAGTFTAIATENNIKLTKLKVSVENKIDLSKAVGLSNNPIVKEVILSIEVSSNTTKEKLQEIVSLAKERCPGVYCLTNPIPLKTEVITN